MVTAHGIQDGPIVTRLLLALLLSLPSLASFGAAPLAAAAETGCCCCRACDAPSPANGEREAREAGCSCGPAPAHPLPDRAPLAVTERAPHSQLFAAFLKQAAVSLPCLGLLALPDCTTARDLPDATPVSMHSRINC